MMMIMSLDLGLSLYSLSFNDSMLIVTNVTECDNST